MRVALVHDHLIQEGGAEQVLKVLHQLWPQAPIYTLLYDQERLGKSFAGADIRPSFLQRMPGALRHYQWFLPLMPTATESYDLMNYDVVISSCSAMAKGLITDVNALHVCYCHTPTRYLWSDTHRYIEELRVPKLIKRVIPPTLTRLRAWDQLAAQRVDSFVANSRDVANRIRKYYRRDSVVIHPPVDTARYSVAKKVGNYYLTGGRLVSYKRFDLTIAAFNRLGIPLKIFGEGPEEASLRAMAKSNIEFVGRVDDEALRRLYAEAIAFIHPQVEDFGLTAVESMAAGRPVIAFGAGGACETVVEGRTGTFFDEQTWESLADTIVRFHPEQFDPHAIKLYAEQYSIDQFTQRLRSHIDTEWTKLQQRAIRCR